MAFFVKPSEEAVRYLRGDLVYNHPVNIDNCTEITKFRYQWYPDNNGLPAIYFKGCDTCWVFSSVDERDRIFENLTNNNFSNLEE